MVRNAFTAAIKTDNAKYEEAVKTLNTLQTNAQTLEQIRQERDKRAHLNIPRMQQFAARAGIQEKDMDRLKVIHVSGTKGKGSTCAYCESLLRHHGYKTGFFSSPHLVEVRERFEVNGIAIAQEKFASYFWEVYNSLEKSKTDHDGLMPNYFGFLTVMAFYVFLREEVDVAIMEVGIGGQYDSTNVVRNPVVCGVTSLGLDHTSILGSTIDKIAWHKAGIFKPGVPAFTVPQPPEAMSVLQQRAQEIGCPLTVCPGISEYGIDIKLGIKGSVQGQNASLALQMCNTWMERQKELQSTCESAAERLTVSNGVVSLESVTDLQTAAKFPLTENHLKGLAECRWLGRNQTVREPDITFYIDGAHTLESMQQCVEWFTVETEEERRTTVNGVYRVLIFNTTGDRDSSCLLRPLLACGFDAVLFCPNIAYEKAMSADQTNNTVTKESQVNRCIENKKTWDQLRESITSSFTNGRESISPNMLQEHKTSAYVASGTASIGSTDLVCKQLGVSHALPSISHCVNWVCKRSWAAEKNGVVGGEIQETVNGVADSVVMIQTRSGGDSKSEVHDIRSCDASKVEHLNGCVNGVQDGSENVISEVDSEALRTAIGGPHVQVLITGSLHLVGGALRVLGDRHNHNIENGFD